MNKGLKDEILLLRRQNFSYNKIAKILNCSKGTISYHCNKANLEDINLRRTITKEEIAGIQNYYKEHTASETAIKFNVSVGSVKYHSDRKTIFLTEEEHKIKTFTRLKNRRKKLKLLGVEYLGGKCKICGYNRCVAALDFHHINPKEKEFSISSRSVSEKRLYLELDKCILLCSNCHREIHNGYRDVFPLPDKQ